MGSEYQWWLVVVALAVAAGVTWLLRGALSRREVDVSDEERAEEASWIAARLRAAGEDVSAGAIERALELHREYLESPPPPLVPGDTTVPTDARAEEPAALTSSPRRDESGEELADRDVPAARYGESRTGS